MLDLPSLAYAQTWKVIVPNVSGECGKSFVCAELSRSRGARAYQLNCCLMEFFGHIPHITVSIV